MRFWTQPLFCCFAWWIFLSVSSCGFVFPWITLRLFTLLVIICCLSRTVCYCGLIYVSFLRDFMPLFGLRVSLSLYCCVCCWLTLIVQAKITIELQMMNPHFAEASLQLVKWSFEFILWKWHKTGIMRGVFCQLFDVFLEFHLTRV